MMTMKVNQYEISKCKDSRKQTENKNCTREIDCIYYKDTGC